MMRGKVFVPALAALIVLAASDAHADDIEVNVDNFTFRNNIAEVVLAITNQTDKDMQWVFTDCAFLDAKKKAVNVGKSIVRHLPRRKTVYDTASATASRPIQYADCQISKAEFAN